MISGSKRWFYNVKLYSNGGVIGLVISKVQLEFLFVDVLSSVMSLVMGVSTPQFDVIVTPACSHLNVGSGYDLTISELAEAIKAVTSCEGEIQFDGSMPDGMSLKLMDSSQINNLGWRSSTSLADGLSEAYSSFLATGA